MVHDGAGHALMATVIGMKQVVLMMEVHNLRLCHGVEFRGGIKVDDGHSPDAAGFQYTLHISVNPLSTLVLVSLGRLNVLFVAIEITTMNGSDEHDLFGRPHLFELTHSDIDAPTISILVHRRHTMAT